jgi:hypothetical protein
MVGWGSKNTKNKCKLCGKFIIWGGLFQHLVEFHGVDRAVAATTPLEENFELIVER